MSNGDDRRERIDRMRERAAEANRLEEKAFDAARNGDMDTFHDYWEQAEEIRRRNRWSDIYDKDTDFHDD